MFRSTSRQKSLFENDSRLSESLKRRLKGSWAEGFVKKVLPVLLAAEDEFSVLYCEDNGRPNWSVARMLGISILKEMQNMSDQQALDCLSFDIRWQHALGVEPEEAYLSRRSILDFRSRMVFVDPEMKMLRSVFNQVGDAAINDLKISTTEQRLDSTIITSNISTFGRLDLFKKTLTNFLKWLKKEHPDEVKNLSKSMRNWSRKVDDNGWFGSVAKLKQPKKRALLSTLASWLYEIEITFTSDESINACEPYLLVKRLIEEHCEIGTDDDKKDNDDDDDDNDDNNDNESNDTSDDTNGVDKIKLRKKVKSPSTSMQSPHDPDAGYSGHKGPGYFAHITETCNNDTTEIVTDYFVEPAGTDTNKDQIAIENLEASGKQPEVLYEDGGYPTAEGMVDAKEKGTQIVAPISTKGNQAEDAICRDQFEFDKDGNCTACPEGHAPLRHGMRTSSSKPSKTLHAFFDGKKCSECKLNNRCMVRPANSGSHKTYHIEIDPALIERDRRKTEQKDKEWWDKYKIRSGIEATISEAKRVNGIGKLRVRRITRVTMAVSLKITACNVKRWIIASEKCEKRGLIPSGPARRPILSLFVLQKASDRFLSHSKIKTQSKSILTITIVEFF
jgi:hypothetical protein